MKHQLIKSVTITLLLIFSFSIICFASANSEYSKGYKYYTKHNFDKALKAFNKAIELKPDYVDALIYRGMIYNHKGLFKKAKSDYDKVLELESDNYLALYNRGANYIEQKNYNHAMSDFSNALKYNSNLFYAHFAIGNIYFIQSKFDKAIENYNLCIQTNGSFEYPYLFKYIAIKRGNIKEDGFFIKNSKKLKKSKNIRPIVELFLNQITPDKCLKKAKNKEQKCEFYYYIGQYFLIKNETEKAKKMFRECVKTDVIYLAEHTFSMFELDRISQ